MDGLSHQRRSSCLLFQMFGVEIYSFLPDDQRDRGNLPGQGETSHRRLRPLGQQSLVESVERSSGDAGHGGCTLEECEVARNVELIRQALANRGFRLVQLHIFWA